MNFTKKTPLRVISLILALVLAMAVFTGCSGKSEIPEGFQYATCNGEYFRLFVPTQWTVNTSSGISGAYVSRSTGNTVTMKEVAFTTPAEMEEGKTDFDYFILEHSEGLKTLNDFKEVSSANKTLGGHRAWEIVYGAKVDGKAMKFRQVLAKAYDRYFVFTYSAFEDHYDLVGEEVDSILAEVAFYKYPYNDGEYKKIPTDVTLPDGMKLVSDDTVAFRFFAPTNWISDDKNESCVAYFSESDRSNVTVLPYMPVDDRITIAEYWEDTEEYYKNNLGSYTLVSTDTDVKLGGLDAVSYVYTYSIGGVEYKTMQIVTVYSTMIYSMTYTAIADNYDAHLDDVSRMAKELVFRKP